MPNTLTKKAVFVVLVAAGMGQRLKNTLPKAYTELCGRSILEHTIHALLQSPLIRAENIQIVINAEHQEYFDGLKSLPDNLPKTCHGGASRAASVHLGLQALNLTQNEAILIHDAARPFVTSDLIGRLIDGLATNDAVIPIVPIADALKFRRDLNDADREQYCLAQTPQAFRHDNLMQAYDRHSYIDCPDEATLCQKANIPMAQVTGSVENFKITYPEDMIKAVHQMSETVYGSGFDLHKMDMNSDPQDIAVGGILIPHQHGLIGHSDGDVVLHALVDALLGTIAGGDIGQHFPPSDPQWRNQNSQFFLETAINMVHDKHISLHHVDITIIADAPKIGPHRNAMQQRLSAMLNLLPHQIGIKATTSEGLGFIDARHAIAAQIMITVKRPKK